MNYKTLKQLAPLTLMLFLAFLLLLKMQDTDTPKDPRYKYVERDKSLPIHGTLIGFRHGEDTVLFTTSGLKTGYTDTIISPMMDVDKMSYLPLKKAHADAVKHGVPLRYKISVQGNAVYQKKPDTTGHTYYMERCGCSGKALNFE